jgi:HlyD family secretion protein
MLAPTPDIADLLKLKAKPGWWRQHLRLVIIVALALVVVVGGIGWWWIARTRATAIQYVTSAAWTGNLEVTASTMGTVEPITQVEVGSEVSGTVTKVYVTYNDTVTAGQVLAEIGTDELADQSRRTKSLLDSARASVIDRQATLMQANRDLSRLNLLAVRGLASNEDLEKIQTVQLQASAALAIASAQVKVAEADLASNQTQIEKASIRAPIAGIVLDRNVDTGQTVAASLQSPVLFTLADDLRLMHVVVDVDEADVGTVNEGDRASFTVEAFPDHVFDAKVIQVRYAPVTVSGVVSYKSVLSVDNAALLLRPGMTASAEIVTDEIAGALLIPNAALRYAPAAATTKASGGGLFGGAVAPQPTTSTTTTPSAAANERQVWVLRAGAAQQVTIKTGLTDGTSTEVLSGDLAVGDLLITAAKAGS